jgi:Fe-S-cluster containining protein
MTDISDTPDADPAASPARAAFPDHELRQPWLKLLLDAYHIADRGVHEGVRRETVQGRQLACAKGCAACCRTHTTIPIYPLELIGLYWYVIEQTAGEIRTALASQLSAHETGQPCPFLVDDVCAVHPLRPLACRQFNVFGRACAEGEDAFHTRRQDVMTPIKRYTDEVFDVMLPYYGIKDKDERRRIIRDGGQHVMAKVLQEYDWSKLAVRMGNGQAGNSAIESR